jgi:hypothetical protein
MLLTKPTARKHLRLSAVSALEAMMGYGEGEGSDTDIELGVCVCVRVCVCVWGGG